MILNLGVSDIPYSFSENLGTSASGKARVSTTGEVAEILEEKYHIMESFWQIHQDAIVAELHDAITGSFESVVSGKPLPNDPHAAAMNAIEAMFNDFLDKQEMDSLGYPGVPTAASLKGVSHRFKHPYAKRPPRPSFIDTGLYESSMRAWIE